MSELISGELENIPLLHNSDPESQSQLTTEFNNPSKSDQRRNPPPYVANMPESTGNAVSATAAPNSEEQAPLVPTLTMSTTALQGVLGDHARIQNEFARIQNENARLRGKLNGEVGEKRLLILFVVFLVLLLFGSTLAPLIINGWLKSKQNAETTS